MTAMTKPGKESPMYVYSDRDIAYLEKQGWTVIKPLKEPVVVVAKRKYQRKAENEHHDIR